MPSSSATASEGAVPKAVDDLGNAGEDLYDAIDARNWREAQTLLARVERAAHALPAAPAIRDQQPALAAEIDSLHRAIAAHDRLPALEGANQVTYRSARLTEPYAPPTPTEVLLLDYYGREVDIWAAQRDSARLRRTVADLRTTWERVKPAVVSHHGEAAARQMDADVARLEAARTPTEYTRASKPFLDQVDVLEKVFTKQ